MSTSNELAKSKVTLDVDDVEVEVAFIHRPGQLAPIVFLHGFGSTKKDYADIVRYSAFDGHPFLAYDAPGCGETRCADLSRISIPFLVDTALAMLRTVGFERFHLVGHSMGGLTALILAHAHPDSARPPCASLCQRSLCRSLRHKVRADAVRRIFESMVDLSDHGHLMEKFLSLPFPRLFMYGEQNASLSYLPYIQQRGVRLEWSSRRAFTCHHGFRCSRSVHERASNDDDAALAQVDVTTPAVAAVSHCCHAGPGPPTTTVRT